jgi:hypothetical protein
MKFNMSMSKNMVFCLGLLLIVLFVSYVNIREGFDIRDIESSASSALNSAKDDVSSAYNGITNDVQTAYANQTQGPQPAANSSLLPDSSDAKSQPADATSTSKKNNKGEGKNNNIYSSYTAPAGDTVLYNKQNKQPNQPKQPIKPSNIPKHKIQRGDEDLYILKSEIVPPVCPACPNLVSCPGNSSTPPPPCPPCGRCAEPAFECKKVPNYNSRSSRMDDYLPRPVLNSFSQFGM